ncbi:hypothetical protein ACJW31_05G083000 [Castanea mollissima]
MMRKARSASKIVCWNLLIFTDCGFCVSGSTVQNLPQTGQVSAFPLVNLMKLTCPMKMQYW